METNLLISSGIVGGCFVFGLQATLLSYQHLKNKKQEKEIAILQLQLDEKFDELLMLEEKRNTTNTFSESLNKAEVVTLLQNPQLQQKRNNTPDTPDKYKFLANMVKSGMSADDVAGILDISVAEAGQLVTLAKMSNSNT